MSTGSPQHRPPARPGSVYAVVCFDPNADRQVAEVVVAFPDPATADQYAVRSGADDYVIAPMAFDVPPRRPQPPARPAP